MVKRELNYRLICNLSKLLERASEQIAARKKYLQKSLPGNMTQHSTKTMTCESTVFVEGKALQLSHI